MKFAFVLITTAPAKEKPVYESLAKLLDKQHGRTTMSEVHPVQCEYDLLCKIEAYDMDELKKYVEENIKTIEGVNDTKVLSGIGKI